MLRSAVEGDGSWLEWSIIRSEFSRRRVSSCVIEEGEMLMMSRCFCGASISGGNGIAGSASECNAPCRGNKLEICGAGNRLALYKSP